MPKFLDKLLNKFTRTTITKFPNSSWINSASFVVEGIKRDEIVNDTVGDVDLAFNNGSTYRYFDVRYEQFLQLVEADSPGRAFNWGMRVHYEWTQVG